MTTTEKQTEFISSTFSASLAVVFLCTVFLTTVSANDAVPHWIWSSDQAQNGERIFLRTSFSLEDSPEKARITVSADNHATVWINNQKLLVNDRWQDPSAADASEVLQQGENVVSIEAENDGGPAAVLVDLMYESPGGEARRIVSDDSWRVTKNAEDGWRQSGFEDDGWSDAVSLGKLGTEPWGDVFAGVDVEGAPEASVQATPVSKLNVHDDFNVELLYSVPKRKQGSWVALTGRPDGRLVASDQGGKGLFVVDPPPVGEEGNVTVERIPVDLSNAQGLEWAFDSLYVNRNGPGSGLWRVQDTNDDGQLDQANQLFSISGGGEHGPHAVVKAPDGKGLYVVGGNHTKPPPNLTGTRQPKNWAEDLLLPRQWDPRGHARGKKAPGGWVCYISPDGKKRVLHANGFRNNYDVAISPRGEMFGFDADMEWDFGLPWYRPTRICHVVSGAEFGWRSGSGKWPKYYPDSLPPAAEVGPGSPTGVVFGSGADFSAEYQRALYALDWTFGTIWAVHLSPNGASYDGQLEEFVSGAPLPVTDATIGADGAFYFTIGGRGGQSGLYRVTYAGDQETDPVEPEPLPEAHQLRRRLEAFHGKQDPEAVETAWPHLGDDRRFIRYAARVAIEHQPVKEWRSRAYSESDPTARIQAMIALARQGTSSDRGRILETLMDNPWTSLSTRQKINALRAYQLTFTRPGKPTEAERKQLLERFDPKFPAGDDRVNRELSRLLVYLESPEIVSELMTLITEEPTDPPEPDWKTELDRNSRYGGTAKQVLENTPPVQKLHYAFVLRNVKYGWTLDQRKKYFAFLKRAAEEYKGGASYPGYIENIRKEARENMTEAEREALEGTGEEQLTGVKLSDLPQPEGPGKNWTVDRVQSLLDEGLQNRDYEHGHRSYRAAKCVVCHRFAGEGGALGPDLTNVSGRYSRQDLISSIVRPNQVVSDRYASTEIKLKDGTTRIGHVYGETDGKLRVALNPLQPHKTTEIPKNRVTSTKKVKKSFMPPGLINQLNREEVLDLMAYLLSRGDPDARYFDNSE